MQYFLTPTVLLYCKQSVQFTKVPTLPARNTAVCPPCPVLSLVAELAAQRLGPAGLDSSKHEVVRGGKAGSWATSCVAGCACWAGSPLMPASTHLVSLHCSLPSAQCRQVRVHAKLCSQGHCRKSVVGMHRPGQPDCVLLHSALIVLMLRRLFGAESCTVLGLCMVLGLLLKPFVGEYCSCCRGDVPFYILPLNQML